ncbi:hypothetical protein [Ruminococcus sp.]|uniref:hypothetical protein n=1 Tax=Ruminococcus sp. TaxID=41978 RepID=UPI0025FA241E|nr:hypothetical protein [Ruminococcus sp.]
MKSNFNKYFSTYFIIKLIIYIILQNTLFIMILGKLSVDLDNDITGYVVIVPLVVLISIFFLFTFTNANAVTKFRRNDLQIRKTTPHDYFKIKAIFTSVLFSLNDLFLHFKFREHLLSEYNEGVRKISMLNSGNLTYRDKLLTDLELLRNKYFKCSVAIVIVVILFHLVGGLFSARKMVEKYYNAE